MFEAMWEWGEEHPEASFDEIAGKLSQERRALMGEMLGELLLQHGDERYEEVACPACGQATKSNGRRTRTVSHADVPICRISAIENALCIPLI